MLTGFRPIQQDLPTVSSPERGVPVIGRYDVIVVGGGTSGAAAGISAARRGMRTLVLEYQHSLGGVGTIGDRAAAPVLAELLQKPGVTGHAITTLSEARKKRGEGERGRGRTVRLVNPAVRELILARALYRCGDHGGLGERILREYERDLQGPLASHAYAVRHANRRTPDGPAAN